MSSGIWNSFWTRLPIHCPVCQTVCDASGQFQRDSLFPPNSPWIEASGACAILFQASWRGAIQCVIAHGKMLTQFPSYSSAHFWTTLIVAAHLGKSTKLSVILGKAKESQQILLKRNHIVYPEANVIKKKHATILAILLLW